MKSYAAILLLGLALTLPVAGNPIIKFKETVVDFGTVSMGKVVDMKYEFENIGDQVLEIRSVRTSCGCTSASLAKTKYEPGEKGTIPVSFNSSGYSGRVVKMIVVLTNDPSQTSINLTLAGSVLNERFTKPEIKPDRLLYGVIPTGTSKSLRFTIVNSGNIDLRILEVQHLPDISLIFPGKARVISPGGAMEVEAVLTPFEKGRIETMIKIRTMDNQNPYLLVKVEAEGK